ncbi:hypothetical protein Tco_1291664 [Tanacetum coccineum]
MTPTEVTFGNTTMVIEVTDMAINIGNGSSVNPTTTTGLSSPTLVISGPFVKVVSEVPSSPDKNGSEQGRSSYARILIEINASNDFSNNLVMAAPKIKGIGFTKETIHVEYEWKPRAL